MKQTPEYKPMCFSISSEGGEIKKHITYGVNSIITKIFNKKVSCRVAHNSSQLRATGRQTNNQK
ncbi:hypothetical protein DZS_08560 [Dickeya ananatis]